MESHALARQVAARKATQRSKSITIFLTPRGEYMARDPNDPIFTIPGDWRLLEVVEPGGTGAVVVQGKGGE